MYIIQAFGKQNTFTIGHKVHKEDKDLHTFCLIFVEYLWHTKIKAKGFAIGIPFVYGIGVLFNWR